MYAANSFACVVIMVWCIWSVLHKKADDGILGITMYCLSCMSAFAVLVGPQYGAERPDVGETTLHISMAALAIREIVIRFILHKRIRFIRR